MNLLIWCGDIGISKGWLAWIGWNFVTIKRRDTGDRAWRRWARKNRTAHLNQKCDQKHQMLSMWGHIGHFPCQSLKVIWLKVLCLKVLCLKVVCLKVLWKSQVRWLGVVSKVFKVPLDVYSDRLLSSIWNTLDNLLMIDPLLCNRYPNCYRIYHALQVFLLFIRKLSFDMPRISSQG